MGEMHTVEEERSSGTGGGRWQPPYIGNPAPQVIKIFIWEGVVAVPLLRKPCNNQNMSRYGNFYVISFL
jgi:hypothetical protein